MPKRKTPVISDLDPNMVSLVEALNSFKAITTVGSCGGHADPGPAQNPLGEWSVAFRLAADEHGWRALEFLAWLGRGFMLRPFFNTASSARSVGVPMESITIMFVRVVLDTCTVRQHVHNSSPSVDLDLIRRRPEDVRLSLSASAIVEWH